MDPRVERPAGAKGSASCSLPLQTACSSRGELAGALGKTGLRRQRSARLFGPTGIESRLLVQAITGEPSSGVLSRPLSIWEFVF